MLLDRYPGINCYKDIILAVRIGSISLFDTSLGKIERLLTKWGTLLVTEQLRIIVTRTLFIKITSLLNQDVIPLQVLQQGLSVSIGKDATRDELIVLCCNLIDGVMMKGYISYEKQMLVLKKGGAFPPLK